MKSAQANIVPLADDCLLAVSPEDERPSFVAVNSFTSNVVAFAAPMLGTLLIGLVGIRMGLVIGAGLRFLGGLLFWYLGVNFEKEPSS